jgi:hypothetical protein
MTTDTVNQVVERLAATEPLTLERFSELLGHPPLKAEEMNPFWRTYTFELPNGPFARGELRLKTSGDGALLILWPRDPQLGEANVDTEALGEFLGIQPNPRIPPEGVVTEFYQKGKAKVGTQWMSRSRRLYSLVLRWEPAAEPAANAN